MSIADSFAAHEVDTRLRISGAVAMFTQVLCVGWGGRGLMVGCVGGQGPAGMRLLYMSSCHECTLTWQQVVYHVAALYSAQMGKAVMHSSNRPAACA